MNKKKTDAEVSLKAQNAPALTGLVTINVAILAGVLSARGLGDLSRFVHDPKAWTPVIPAAVLVALTGVANEQLSPAMKARLVFLRWADPLPGARAFSELGPADRRVDMARVFAAVGSTPTSPDEQNRAWYALYKPRRALASVVGAHKSFLLWRDFTAISAMIGAIGVVFTALFAQPVELAIAYYAFIVIQWLVVRNAAATAGRRMVTNVLAEI